MLQKGLVLDICAGTKSATAAWKDAGHQVFTIDNDPANDPDLCADVRLVTAKLFLQFANRTSFVWASPPCTEFAREFMPWCKTGLHPDLSIAAACKNLIDRINPTWWVIENVKGAVSYFREIGLGYPRAIVGPFYLWGNFPPLPKVDRRTWRSKSTMSSTWDAERGAIPYTLSKAIYDACNNQMVLL